jgi:hypothetical protein
MTQFQPRFALACALSSALFFSAAQAKRPKAAANTSTEDVTVCVASDASSGDVPDDACAVNLPPDRTGDDTPAIIMDGVSDDSDDIKKPRPTKELQQALRELDKLGDDEPVPCDGGDLSIIGVVDDVQNLIVNPMDIASIRAEPGENDNGRKQGRVIIQLCPSTAKNVREARSVETFMFSGESVPLIDGKIAINAAGEISIDRETLERAKVEAELLRRTCLVQCSWSQ